MKPSVSSLYQSVEIAQEIPPLLIGERANPNGSKKFKELLLADDYDGCLRVGLDQEAGGAQILDLCVAYAGRDESADMTRLVKMYAESIKAPLMIDSTTPACIEEALSIYPGRCIVNSINLEDGGANLNRVCTAVKKYGAAVVALTINEKGMAMTTQEKVDTARNIYNLAVGEHGLRPQDLLFDPLTFTIGSGDETLRDAAVQTLNAIKRIKEELPGVFTILGLSNISFGLRPAARRILNSVFLHEAVEAGLDATIIDAAKILPLSQINEEDRKFCLDLIYDRQENPEISPLMIFIDHFEKKAGTDTDSHKAEESQRPEEQMHNKILTGDKDGLHDLLAIIMQRNAPLDIINQLLVPAMRHVGELFGTGEILLPFVLQSAEVMKRSVSYLEQFMEKSEEAEGEKTSILLATVQGDVHDIGKNLVDIILSNNGYKVHNIGIKVPAERIIEKAREYNVDIIGLSGLLVKSAIIMQENMPQFKEAGLTQPILLGGAALTPKFVAESCVPGYAPPVVYCADAFAGLRAVREFEEGKLGPTTWESRPKRPQTKTATASVEVDRTVPVPDPPFLGARTITNIDPEKIFPLINKQALFRGRWGYRRGKMSAEEYTTLIDETVEPIYQDILRRSAEEGLSNPMATYGYFRCFSRGDSLFVQHEGETHQFDFPRQSFPPHLCIADFYKTEEEGGDITSFFVVTLGETIAQATKKLFESDSYHDYLMLHGFSVEATDALAEYWHEEMRKEWGIATAAPDDTTGYVTQQYQGSRYGFGYPACPDMEAHIPLFKLLNPESIGVTLTENMEMVPEQTTSAIISHHPQAKYFAV